MKSNIERIRGMLREYIGLINESTDDTVKAIEGKGFTFQQKLRGGSIVFSGPGGGDDYLYKLSDKDGAITWALKKSSWTGFQQRGREKSYTSIEEALNDIKKWDDALKSVTDKNAQHPLMSELPANSVVLAFRLNNLDDNILATIISGYVAALVSSGAVKAFYAPSGASESTQIHKVENYDGSSIKSTGALIVLSDMTTLKFIQKNVEHKRKKQFDDSSISFYKIVYDRTKKGQSLKLNYYS